MDTASRTRNGIGAKWWWPRVPFALLLICCGTFAYRPALNRVFSGDQFGYFAELHGETSLRSGLRLLDYGVQRQYWRGDQMCYRPLLFAGLALENAWFKRDFRSWNKANLGIHLAVSYLLFEILWRTRRSLLACGFALWFALLASNFELVAWCHLGGYMMGYGLLLLALYARGRMAEDHSGVRWFWAYGAAIVGAMLVHEIAVVAGVGVALQGAWLGYQRRLAPRGRWWATLGVPILIYATLYIYHASQCDRFFWLNASGGGVKADSIADWPAMLLRWMQHVCLPRDGQLASEVGERSLWLPWPGGMPPQVLASVVLWIGFLIGLRRAWTWHAPAANAPFGNGSLILVAVYAALISVGRPSYARFVPYYDYFPALMGTVWLYSRIDFARIKWRDKLAAGLCLVALAAINGEQVRCVGSRMQEQNRPWAEYFGWVEQSVRLRLAARNFSFDVAGTPEEMDMEGEITIGYPDRNQIKPVHVLEVLYGRLYAPHSPSEILVYPQGEAKPHAAGSAVP